MIPNVHWLLLVTKEATLISNLTPGVKPIATKSRCFNEADRVFIEKTVKEWLKEGIIQPSLSPWRAQVLVKNELNCHRKTVVCRLPANH